MNVVFDFIEGRSYAMPTNDATADSTVALTFYAAEQARKHPGGLRHMLRCSECRPLLLWTTRVGHLWLRTTRRKAECGCSVGRVTGKRHGLCAKHFRLWARARGVELGEPPS